MHRSPEHGAGRARWGVHVPSWLDSITGDPHPWDLIPKQVPEPNIPKAGLMVVWAWNN